MFERFEGIGWVVGVWAAHVGRRRRGSTDTASRRKGGRAIRAPIVEAQERSIDRKFRKMVHNTVVEKNVVGVAGADWL